MCLVSSLLLRTEIVKVVLLWLLLLLSAASLSASLWWPQVVEVVLIFLLNFDLALGLGLVVLAVRRILREVAVLCRLCCLPRIWVRGGIVHASPASPSTGTSPSTAVGSSCGSACWYSVHWSGGTPSIVRIVASIRRVHHITFAHVCGGRRRGRVVATTTCRSAGAKCGVDNGGWSASQCCWCCRCCCRCCCCSWRCYCG